MNRTGFGDNTDVFDVPTNHCFVMGDDRDNSADSRAGDGAAGVPFSRIH